MGNTVLDTDRETFAGYVSRALTEFHIHAVNGHVWNADKINAARYLPAGLDFTDPGVFTGPWHVVRKWVTTEFREWVEGYGNVRMTFAEWRAVRIEDRRRQDIANEDYLSSAAYCVDELSALRELQNRRDELILTARERGASWRTIGDAIGMSRAQLHNIATRHAVRIANAVPAGVPWDDDEPF